MFVVLFVILLYILQSLMMEDWHPMVWASELRPALSDGGSGWLMQYEPEHQPQLPQNLSNELCGHEGCLL